MLHFGSFCQVSSRCGPAVPWQLQRRYRLWSLWSTVRALWLAPWLAACWRSRDRGGLSPGTSMDGWVFPGKNREIYRKSLVFDPVLRFTEFPGHFSHTIHTSILGVVNSFFGRWQVDAPAMEKAVLQIGLPEDRGPAGSQESQCFLFCHRM